MSANLRLCPSRDQGRAPSVGSRAARVVKLRRRACPADRRCLRAGPLPDSHDVRGVNDSAPRGVGRSGGCDCGRRAQRSSHSRLGRAAGPGAACGRGRASGGARCRARASALLECAIGRRVRHRLVSPRGCGDRDPAARRAYRPGRFPDDPRGDQRLHAPRPAVRVPVPLAWTLASAGMCSAASPTHRLATTCSSATPP